MNTNMLASTRFNSKTYEENETYREKREIGCAYGTQNKIKTGVPLNTLLFIVEMNNEKNRIEGIGLIRNMISPDSHKIYSENNYNRYTYLGKYRITREQLEEMDKDLVDILELLLFKGYTHIKRHTGITIIPEKLLQCDRSRGMDFREKIKTMFRSSFYKEKV